MNPVATDFLEKMQALSFWDQLGKILSLTVARLLGAGLHTHNNLQIIFKTNN